MIIPVDEMQARHAAFYKEEEKAKVSSLDSARNWLRNVAAMLPEKPGFLERMILRGVMKAKNQFYGSTLIKLEYHLWLFWTPTKSALWAAIRLYESGYDVVATKFLVSASNTTERDIYWWSDKTGEQAHRFIVNRDENNVPRLEFLKRK